MQISQVVDKVWAWENKLWLFVKPFLTQIGKRVGYERLKWHLQNCSTR